MADETKFNTTPTAGVFTGVRPFPVELNTGVLATNFQPAIPPDSSPRVVGQSIPPGTQVPKGTAVDIKVTATTGISTPTPPPTPAPTPTTPTTTSGTGHADLQPPISDNVLKLSQLGDVQKMLFSFEDGNKVPPDEKAFLTSMFQEFGVRVDDSRAALSFANAFNGLRAIAIANSRG